MTLIIWLVDYYKKLKNVHEKKIKKKYLNFISNFNNKVIWVNCWINQIQKLSDKSKNL